MNAFKVAIDKLRMRRGRSPRIEIAVSSRLDDDELRISRLFLTPTPQELRERAKREKESKQ